MLEHRIEIAPVRHKYSVHYLGEHLGDFRVPECEAARHLIDRSHAEPGDVLISCRDGVPALTGSVGWLAARTIDDGDKVSPHWSKWRPFALAPKDGPETVCGGAPEPHVETLEAMTA